MPQNILQLSKESPLHKETSMKKRGERKKEKNKREKKNQVSQCFSGHSTISKAIYFSSRAEASLDLECISVWPLPELQSIPLASVYLMSNLCCTYL